MLVIAKGDSYVFEPDSSKEKMLDFWCGNDKHTYVALFGANIAGTFMMKDNFPDLGSHVVNAGYMTSPGASGKGVGRAMCEFSLKEAKRLGYKAMQFNMVVKSNERAVKIWKKMGFDIIGEVPDAFNHKELGYTNAYIMWKRL